MIVKALNDLTLALTERRNKKGIEEMDALQRFNEILNKIPTKPTHAPEHTKRVTFEATAKPTPRVADQMPTPRVATQRQLQG